MLFQRCVAKETQPGRSAKSHSRAAAPLAQGKNRPLHCTVHVPQSAVFLAAQRDAQ
jgi:hypothetical protein